MSAKRFLKRSTVTDVVSVTMSGDDVFSTDFRWYWINCTARNTTANSPNFDMRMTVGGLPHTKGVYQMSGTDLNADASRSDVNFSDTDRIPNIAKIRDDQDGTGFNMWIVNPAHEANTILWSQSAAQTNVNNNFRARFNAYALEDTNVYDGFQLYTNTSSTIDSGGWFTIDVYGLQS